MRLIDFNAFFLVKMNFTRRQFQPVCEFENFQLTLEITFFFSIFAKKDSACFISEIYDGIYSFPSNLGIWRVEIGLNDGK